MSAVESSKTPSQSGFFAKYEVDFYTAAAVTSFALALLSLGVMVAAMGTSSTWYFTKWSEADDLGHGVNKIPDEISFADDIQNTMQVGAQVGAVALGTCAVAASLFILALYLRHHALEKQNATDASNTPSANTILFLVGLSVGSFSAGLMIGSSVILDKGVAHMHDLIEQGRNEYPHTMKYTNPWYDFQHGVQHGIYGEKIASDQSFWDAIQSDWFDPTKSAMSGMLPVGLFGSFGGGALCILAAVGHGISHCKKSQAKETSS